MKVLILTDNSYAHETAMLLKQQYGNLMIAQSPDGPLGTVPRLDVRRDLTDIVARFSLIISIHCRQYFPAALVRSVRCVNVHPGYNPDNRGWYPQVFSILNGLKAGVTIHEMDERLDHGPIIAQEEYQIRSWDTSGSVYEALMRMERDLLVKWFPAIIAASYQTYPTTTDGNLNRQGDFESLKRLDLGEVATYGAVIDRLRALTHAGFRNAHFYDQEGRKVYVSIKLEPEERCE